MSGEPRTKSATEIELYLRGDAKDVDRLILEGLNNLTCAFTTFRDEEFRAHIKEELEKFEKMDALAHVMGDEDTIRARAQWIDAQIEAQRDRTAMMRRVRDSVLIWVVIAFLGYLAVTSYDDFRSKLSTGVKNESRPVP